MQRTFVSWSGISKQIENNFFGPQKNLQKRFEPKIHCNMIFGCPKKFGAPLVLGWLRVIYPVPLQPFAHILLQGS